uniref:Uncharacterized protein n=1 Tax=Arundo donax TaxID=35708 RepID=A0A0A8Z7Q2_ARUDO
MNIIPELLLPICCWLGFLRFTLFYAINHKHFLLLCIGIMQF